MEVSAIVVMEIPGGRQPEFIDFLCKKENGYGFYRKWKADSDSIFSLPGNCVWCKTTSEVENTTQADLIKATLEKFTALAVKFNEQSDSSATPIIIEKVLVVLSKPWAALEDVRPAPELLFGGWKDEETQKKYGRFKENYLKTYPTATDDQIKDIFKIAQSAA